MGRVVLPRKLFRRFGGEIIRNAMKRVLIITFFFPPRPGVASLRLRGLAKYLPDFGWEPVILTPKLPKAPDPRFRVIETPYPGDVAELLLKKVGWLGLRGSRDAAGVFRVELRGNTPYGIRTLNLAKRIARTFIYPDNQKGWYPYALTAGRRLLAGERFDALISSFGPATTHLVARSLKLEVDLPWVADFRDLWTQDPFYRNYYFPSTLRLLFERRLEVHTIRSADALVTVSDPLAEKLRSLHRGKRVEVIPNGFDPEEAVEGQLSAAEKFSLLYSGNLYEGKRDPTPLFHALRELIDRGQIDQRDIEVSFYGGNNNWLIPLINALKLEEVVKEYPSVPREVILARQRNSQALILLDWKDPDGQGIYTGKLFEYLAAKRPILAFGGRSGVVADLLEETQAGMYAKTIDELKGILLTWYAEYKRTGRVAYRGRWEKVEKYSHRVMAGKFARLLDSVVEGR